MARHRKDPFADDFLDDDSDLSSAPEDDLDVGSSSGLGSHARKRMRRSKDDAVYGIFGDDEDAANEAEGGMGSTVRARDAKGRKVDYRAGQTFVPASSSTTQRKDASEDDAEAESLQAKEEEADEEKEVVDDFQPTSFYSSRQHRGGLGSGSQISREPREPTPPKALNAGGRAGIGARAGIGSRSINDQEGEAGPSKRKSGLTSLSMFVSAGASKVSDTKVPPHEVAPSISTAKTTATAAPSTAPPQGIAMEEELSAAGLPTAFAAPKPTLAPSSAFQRGSKPTPPPSIPPTSIKFGSKFDPSAYLASMGWTGGGLGKSGQGIVAPIEVQLRPERAGIAYGGLKEKTQQARDEARRRGQGSPSPPPSGKKQKGKKEKRPVWTQPEREKKPRKPKIEHRTYEQILSEIGAAPAPAGGEKIYDASSGQLREVTDLASALGRKKGVPTASQSVLPELQHNLRLICDANGQTLAALAREGRQIMDRRRWLKGESEMEERKQVAEVSKTQRIREVLILVRKLEEVSGRASVEVEDRGKEVLDGFTSLVQELGANFADEILELGLDEAVIGAVAPIFRVLWSSGSWTPLRQPHAGVSYLKQWLAVIRPSPTSTKKTATAVVMTSYESLLWTLWMPSIRSSLNNAFKPHHPSSALVLLETWHPLLPTFIFDNIIQQLLLPKLRAGIAMWDARTSTWGLEHVVFPWLPLLGISRMQEVLDEAKRRLRSGLKVLSLDKGPSKGLGQWRKFYTEKEGGRGEWEGLMLSTLVPRLSSYLERQFRVDPVNQNLEPLNVALGWKGVIGRSTVKRVVVADLFPKWLQVLCDWLKQPQVQLGEVAEWYEFWRSFFLHHHLVEEGEREDGAANIGFCLGLNLINSALDHPLDQRGKLRPPAFTLPSRHRSSAPKKATTPELQDDSEKEVATFRSVLIDELATHDMFLLKTSEVHRISPTATTAVWRVSKSPSGAAGGGGKGKEKSVKVFIDDDVVFLHHLNTEGEGEGEWEPISISTLVAALE